MKYLPIIIVIVFLCLSYCLIPTYVYKVIYLLKRKKSGSKIYLTFDDGPSGKYTSLLLDVLKKHRVNASFFVVSDFAIKNSEIIKRMTNDGHGVYYHSKSHEDYLLVGPYKTIKLIKKGYNDLKNIGITPKYFRAPWGRVNIPMLIYIKKLGMKLKLWNVMAEDWESAATVLSITNKLLDRVNGGDIICLHDNRGCEGAPLKTIEALDKVIPMLKKKGLSFEVIE